MTDTKNWEEELIKFVMDTANGIDDYNWGQKKFEIELRQKVSILLSQTQLETLEWCLEQMGGVIEPPEDVELLRDKRQAFMAGQMNVLMRSKAINNKIKSLKKNY